MNIEDRERVHAERGKAICLEQGYSDYRAFANGRDAAIRPLLFTVAILADLTEWGYGSRWCFGDYKSARAALDAWNGEGEPQGWHREPSSGRRRVNGDPATEYIEF